MAKYTFTDGRTIDIPDDGGAFRTGDSVYVRTGNGLKAVNLSDAGLGLFKPTSNAPAYNNLSSSQREALGVQALKQAGVNVDSLESISASRLADIRQAFDRQGGGTQVTNDLSVFKSTPKNIGEKITESISSVNPNGVDIVSSTSGNVVKTKSVQENLAGLADTIESMTPAQQQTFAAVSSGRAPLDEIVKSFPANTPEQKASLANIITQFGGNPVTYGLPAPSGATGGPAGTTNFSSEQRQQIASNFGADLEARLKNYPGLSDSEKQAIRLAGTAIASNDEDLQKRFLAAVELAIPNADAIFKEKLRLAQSEITNAFSEEANDLTFKLKQKENALKDVRDTLTRQGDYLSLEEQAQLREIEGQYVQDLEETRQSAAEAGLTFSTRAAKKEELLGTQKGELRESTARKFGLQKAEAGSKLSIAERDTQSEIARLQEIAKANTQEILRKGEARVGTANLPALNTGGAQPAGGVTGDLLRERNSSIIQGTSFAF